MGLVEGEVNNVQVYEAARDVRGAVVQNEVVEESLAWGTAGVDAEVVSRQRLSDRASDEVGNRIRATGAKGARGGGLEAGAGDPSVGPCFEEGVQDGGGSGGGEVDVEETEDA